MTQAIDLHHAVMASLGERFLLYRIAEVDADDLADAALGSVGKEAMMRRELSAAVRSFCECAISARTAPFARGSTMAGESQHPSITLSQRRRTRRV